MTIKLKKNTVKKVQEGVKIKDNAIDSTTEGNAKVEAVPFYFKESIINQIKKGSMETFSESVKDMAYKNIEKIVGENCHTNLHFVGTFKKHAVVADDSSNLYRLHYSESDEGINLDKVEEIKDIKKYDESAVACKFEDQLSEALCKSIERVDDKDSELFKESFNRMLQFKKNGFAESFVQIVKQESMKNNTEELK